MLRVAPFVALALLLGCNPGREGESETFVTTLDLDTDSGEADTGSTSSDTSDTGTTSGESSETSTSDTSDTEGPHLECPTLGPWDSSAPFAMGDEHSHPLPSFAVGDWYYVHVLAGDQRPLWSATPNPDGTLGAWQLASPDHGGGPHGYTAIAVGDGAYHFRNGHIAQYVFDDQGLMVGDVVLLESDTNTAFGGEKFVWDAAIHLGFSGGGEWVFHLGGFSFTPYDYRRAIRRNSVPLGPMFGEVGFDHPASRPGKVAAFVPEGASMGYLFLGEPEGGGLWRASVGSDGALLGVEALDPLPAGTGNQRGDWFVLGRALFVIRGSAVFRALIGDDGTLGAWQPMPSLPEEQIDVNWGDGHCEGAAWGRIGDDVYVTGPRVVFHSRLLAGEC